MDGFDKTLFFGLIIVVSGVIGFSILVQIDIYSIHAERGQFCNESGFDNLGRDSEFDHEQTIGGTVYVYCCRTKYSEYTKEVFKDCVWLPTEEADG